MDNRPSLDSSGIQRRRWRRRQGEEQKTAKRTKRHPQGSVLRSCIGHWPPVHRVAGGSLRLLRYRFYRPVNPSLLRAASWAVALAGFLHITGLAEVEPSSHIITGAY